MTDTRRELLAALARRCDGLRVAIAIEALRCRCSACVAARAADVHADDCACARCHGARL